jgi:hypothetical protein
MGLLTSACDYFHKLREIFSFPRRHRKLLKDKAEGFLLCIFSKRNIYLFESVARRLQVIQMPLQGTYLQAKVIELCVWLPSSFLTWMLDRKIRTANWEMRKLFNLNGIPPPPHEFLGKIPQSIPLRASDYRCAQVCWPMLFACPSTYAWMLAPNPHHARPRWRR